MERGVLDPSPSSPPRRGAAVPQRAWSVASASDTSEERSIGRRIIERMFYSVKTRRPRRACLSRLFSGGCCSYARTGSAITDDVASGDEQRAEDRRSEPSTPFDLSLSTARRAFGNALLPNAFPAGI